MINKEFIIIMGIPGAGKSSIAKELLKNNDYVYINLDNIHKENNQNQYGLNGEKEVRIAEKRMKEARDRNQNVIYDAVNASHRKRKHLLEQFKSKGYKTRIIFINASVDEAIQNNSVRVANGGHDVDDKSIKDIYKHMTFPLLNEVDEIKVITNEKVNVEAVQNFDSELLITNPYRWVEENEEFIRNFIPELYQTKGFLQFNQHHTLNVFDHSLKATNNMSLSTNKIELILAALFHDLGKFYTRKFTTVYNDIKYQILNSNDFILNEITDTALLKPMFKKDEPIQVDRNQINGIYGSFLAHENISSKLAYNICIRLGMSANQAFYIANIIQLHMEMPHLPIDDITEEQWNKFNLKCGFIRDELIQLRLADANAK